MFDGMTSLPMRRSSVKADDATHRRKISAPFLSAMVCLGNGAYRLHGVLRMHERPQAALFKALRELGYRVDSATDKGQADGHR